MSNNLDLSQVAENQNQKFQTINDKGGELDAAITELFEADVSSGNVTVTAAQYRRAILIKATGAATSGRTVTLQAIKRLVLLANFSTTDSVDFILGSATITVPAAADAANPGAVLAYTDGTTNGLYAVASGSGGGGGDFIDLDDVPSAYTGHGGKRVKVNSGATGLEFAADTIGDIDDVSLTSLTQGQMLRRNGSNQWVNEDTPYLLSMFIPGTHGNGALMAQHVFDRDVSFPVDLASSQGYSQVTATASTTLDVQKNGADIGTITFTNAGDTATFVLAGGATFAAGDRLAIINENPADSTLADLSITLRGKRV
jgi:hypothetical protein